MCFQEYIGYTCGHRSMSVLRPCPLTTSEHKNPVCSIHAERPFHSRDYCPVCARIMHTRAVLIQEWEHHFLHERGACGCDVVFPDLVRPRVVGGDSVFAHQAAMDQNPSAYYQVPKGGKGKPVNTSKAVVATNNNTGGVQLTAYTSAGDKPLDGQTAPPIFEERRGPAGQTAFAVRLPSLYAAEWVNDHRIRHENGSCKCPADFAPYKPDWVAANPEQKQQQHEANNTAAAAENNNIAIVQQDVVADVDMAAEPQQQQQLTIQYATPIAIGTDRPHIRRAYSVDMRPTMTATCLDDDAIIAAEPMATTPRRSRRASSVDLPSPGVINTGNFAATTDNIPDSHYPPTPPGSDRRLSHDGSLHWGVPVFQQQQQTTAQQQVTRGVSDMRLHGTENTFPRMQQQVVNALPIAGLPVGAGPEGVHRHMPAFSRCVLHRYPRGSRNRRYN